MSTEKLAGVIFRSQRGNRSFYDDNTGLVFACPDVMWELLNRYEGVSEQEVLAAMSDRFSADEVSSYYRFVDRWSRQEKAFFLSSRIPRHASTASREELESYLQRNGFMQLILNVTEDCNLRCRYCAYSYHYPLNRPRKATRMEFRVAQQAVDYYLKGFEQVRLRNPSRRPVVGFYGGEPLLNFKLVRQVIEYIKASYSEEVYLNVTTNGTLMTDRIADYLVKNNVAISFSLDGPKAEHDRLRVDAGGEGTFDRVYPKIARLHRRYPEHKAILILSCYDWGTDLEAVQRFFDDHLEELPLLGKASLIYPFFTTYYEQYGANGSQRMSSQINELKRAYFDDLRQGSRSRSEYLERLIGMDCRFVLLRPMAEERRLPFVPYTRPCVPGDKIAVDPDGTFHLCEKMNQHYPIGHVDSGINLELVSSIMQRYSQQVLSSCSRCPITRLCSVCYSRFAGEKQFLKAPSDLCEKSIQAARARLAFTYSILEENPNAYQELITHHFARLAETRTVDI